MEKVTKYGWTYITEGSGDKRTFKIIPSENTETPSTLYKLYSLTDDSVDSILNQYIYATHPHLFNDIFDCYEDLIEFDDVEFVKHFVKEYVPDRFPGNKLDEELKNNFKGLSTFVKRNFREMVYQGYGVFSMTSNAYNLLMWSYYTNHAGFFVEYDYKKFPFKFHGPFPLNYQEEITSFSITECGIPLAMLLQTNLKYKGWEHESEWRLLVESDERMYSPSFEAQRALGGHDRKFKYPIEAIKQIGFGNRFFEPEEMRTKSDKILHITLKKNVENKSKLLDFLVEKNISTFFTLRDGLIRISYTGMLIEKIGEKEYLFDIDKWAKKQQSKTDS